jgi:hypothetical protein
MVTYPERHLIMTIMERERSPNKLSRSLARSLALSLRPFDCRERERDSGGLGGGWGVRERGREREREREKERKRERAHIIGHQQMTDCELAFGEHNLVLFVREPWAWTDEGCRSIVEIPFFLGT